MSYTVNIPLGEWEKMRKAQKEHLAAFQALHKIAYATMAPPETLRLIARDALDRKYTPYNEYEGSR